MAGSGIRQAIEKLIIRENDADVINDYVPDIRHIGCTPRDNDRLDFLKKTL